MKLMDLIMDVNDNIIIGFKKEKREDNTSTSTTRRPQNDQLIFIQTKIHEYICTYTHLGVFSVY